MARRRYRIAVVTGPLVLGLLAGCAARISSVSAPAAPPEGNAPRTTLGTTLGTILAMRPALAGQRPALPGLPTESSPVGETQATEFIIRLDGAGTISVVQPGAPGFRPADRVIILAGPPARLARLD